MQASVASSSTPIPPLPSLLHIHNHNQQSSLPSQRRSRPRHSLIMPLHDLQMSSNDNGNNVQLMGTGGGSVLDMPPASVLKVLQEDDIQLEDPDDDDDDPVYQKHRKRAPIKKWTKEEDSLLRKGIMSYVTQNIPINFEEVALLIPGRSVKQTKERWKNSLNPSIRKGEWSNQELIDLLDLIIAKAQNWTDIQKELPNRSMHCIKSKGRKLLGETLSKRLLKKCTKIKLSKKGWTPEEVQKAVKLHLAYISERHPSLLSTCNNQRNINVDVSMSEEEREKQGRMQNMDVFEFACSEGIEEMLETICIGLGTARPTAQIDRKLLEGCECRVCSVRTAHLQKTSLEFKIAWTQTRAKIVKLNIIRAARGQPSHNNEIDSDDEHEHENNEPNENENDRDNEATRKIKRPVHKTKRASTTSTAASRPRRSMYKSKSRPKRSSNVKIEVSNVPNHISEANVSFSFNTFKTENANEDESLGQQRKGALTPASFFPEDEHTGNNDNTYEEKSHNYNDGNYMQYNPVTAYHNVNLKQEKSHVALFDDEFAPFLPEPPAEQHYPSTGNSNYNIHDYVFNQFTPIEPPSYLNHIQSNQFLGSNMTTAEAIDGFLGLEGLFDEQVSDHDLEFEHEHASQIQSVRGSTGASTAFRNLSFQSSYTIHSSMQQSEAGNGASQASTCGAEFYPSFDQVAYERRHADFEDLLFDDFGVDNSPLVPETPMNTINNVQEEYIPILDTDDPSSYNNPKMLASPSSFSKSSLGMNGLDINIKSEFIEESRYGSPTTARSRKRDLSSEEENFESRQENSIFDQPTRSLRKMDYKLDESTQKTFEKLLENALDFSDKLKNAEENDNGETGAQEVMTIVKNYTRNKDSTSDSLAQRIIQTFGDYFSTEGLSNLHNQMKKNNVEWLNPSVCFMLDKVNLCSERMDPRFQKDYLCPDSIDFDPNRPVGTQILDFVSKLFLDCDENARMITKGNMANKHAWLFVPSPVEGLLRVYYMVPKLMATGECWSYVRMYRCDGTQTVFLCHYKLLNRKTMKCMVRFQDASHRMTHVLTLPELY